MPSSRLALVVVPLVLSAPSRDTTAAHAAPSADGSSSWSAPRVQERVAFATSDSGVVAADVYGRGPRGVVLVHGGRFDRASWAPQARALADAGFRVLALDLRGRGETRPGRAGADSMHLDVIAAVRHLRAGGAERVALVGASLGGWAAAEAAIALGPPQVDRLVLLAHAAVDHPDRLPPRTLFLVARGDTTARGVPRLVAIRAQHERAPEPKRLVVLDGTAHAQLLFRTDQGDRLLGEIVRFLSKP